MKANRINRRAALGAIAVTPLVSLPVSAGETEIMG